MLNIAEPTPPLPRSTISSAKDLEHPASTLLTATTAMPAAITRGLTEAVHQTARGQRPDHSHQREDADHAGRHGATLTPNWRAKAGMAGAHDPEPECDRERYRGENRHFWRQIPGTGLAGHRARNGIVSANW